MPLRRQQPPDQRGQHLGPQPLRLRRPAQGVQDKPPNSLAQWIAGRREFQAAQQPGQEKRQAIEKDTEQGEGRRTRNSDNFRRL